jgi:lysozyme family protein
MMVGNFPACSAFTLHEEGGLSMYPRDSGNWTGGAVGVGTLAGTNFGIAAASHPGVDIRSLTVETATAIYAREYWAPLSGDNLPEGVDLIVYDFAVNAGVSRSAKMLQAAVGLPPAEQDGLIGPGTRVAIALNHTPVSLIGTITAAHEAFYRSTAAFPLYGEEWLARLARCNEAALAMAANEPAEVSPLPPMTRAAPPRPMGSFFIANRLTA